MIKLYSTHIDRKVILKLLKNFVFSIVYQINIYTFTEK
jgi:hypothetical protein